MKGYIRTAVVLACICAVAAILLALVNSITTPHIEAYEAGKVTKALEEVANGLEIGEKTEVGSGYVDYVHPLYSNGVEAGYIVSLTSRGYGGDIVLLAGYGADGSVTAVTIVSDSETPGVGKKAHNEGYMDKFIGKGGAGDPVPTSKNMLSDADSAAVSGATMTFSGISAALKAGSDYVVSMKEASL